MASLAPAPAARERVATWIEAARPRTLPAAVAPVAVGSSLAAAEGAAHPGYAALAGLTALLLQIGANFANDVFDFERGADAADRLGPRRAVAAGRVSPRAMRLATTLAFALAATTGLALVMRGGWPIALVGLAALAAGLAYTGGPWPLGYHGLGEPLVFVFFGVVGVAGTHYVQALATSPLAFGLSVPVGLLATAILVVNNLRDRIGDERAGKRTLAVRLGAGPTRATYGALVLGAYGLVAVGVGVGALGTGVLLVFASAPYAVGLVRRLARTDGRALNPCLGATARLEAGFAGLLALGLLW